MGKYRYPILDVSVTDIGVQIVLAHCGQQHLPKKRYTKDDEFFNKFLKGFAWSNLNHVEEIKDLQLVAVDIQGNNSQFSYMPKSYDSGKD